MKRKTTKAQNKQTALPPEAYDNVPRLALAFTDEAIFATKYDERGAPTVTYPVSVREVANAFQDFGASTGLLTPETLWWQSKNGTTEIAIWLPPVKRTLSFAAGRQVHKLTLAPLGFVFIGTGTRYKIFASPERPLTDNATLYHAPLPNVQTGGLICAGNVEFPQCEAATISKAAVIFFESYFNSDLSNGKLKDCKKSLFKELQALPKNAFPTRRLVYATTVGQLLSDSQVSSLAPDDVDDEDEDNDELD